MLASELIELLKTVPGDTPILLSSDAEGNEYSGTDSYDDEGYVEKDWNGGRLDSLESFETEDGEPHPEDEMDQLKRVFVLWPN